MDKAQSRPLDLVATSMLIPRCSVVVKQRTALLCGFVVAVADTIFDLKAP